MWRSRRGRYWRLRHQHAGASESVEYRWIIDPIDSTKSFMRGAPLYGVLRETMAMHTARTWPVMRRLLRNYWRSPMKRGDITCLSSVAGQ
ncbi:MAG: hypothetical protein IMZ73_02075 [Chloroflexi bacterium]|nr:hypothetical protein [Chloroflexota bacterium]